MSSQLNKFDSEFVCAYFDVIEKKASPENPLHRAKAMKWAIASKETFNALIDKHKRQEIWEICKIESRVCLNEMGYIIGLNLTAREFLNKRVE